MFEFDDRVGASLHMYSIASWSPSQSDPLIGVIHVPAPVVLAHVAKRGTDASLRCNRMAARRENLGNTGRAKSRLGQAKGGAQAGAARPDDDDIVTMIYKRVFTHNATPPRVTFTAS